MRTTRNPHEAVGFRWRLLAWLAASWVLCSLPSVTARAEPVDGGGRVGLLGGWRYQPNTRFGELSADSGYPLEASSPGGPCVLSVFGYRTSLQLEVAIEIGYARERFGLRGAPALELTHMPLAIATRWSPWTGKWTPYVGGGYAYFLNFFSGGPAGGLESHGTGPFGMVGSAWQVSERIAVIAEYRLGLSRVEVPGLGALQVGGNALMIGAQLEMPPEPSGLR